MFGGLNSVGLGCRWGLPSHAEQQAKNGQLGKERELSQGRRDDLKGETAEGPGRARWERDVGGE